MFYRIIKAIVKPFFFALFRVKVIGKENAKYSGKMMVIANHRSGFDPIFMHLLVKPKVQFMAKKELFKNPLLRWLIKYFGAFPVDRGKGDLGAVKFAFKLLNEGGTLGIFPEGTRTRSDEMIEFQHGLAVIALRTGAPILPIFFSRTFRPFRKTYIIVGKQIDLKEFFHVKISHTEEVKLVTNYLFYKMQQLEHEAEKLCK